MQRSHCIVRESIRRAFARSKCTCRRASCNRCEPVANKRRPTSDYDAKFSLVYAVASGLLRGRLGLKELTPEAFRTHSAEPDGSHRIRRGCQDHIPASLHRRGPRHARRRRAVRHREPVNRGHAERPLSNDEVREKFFDNATLHFSRSHAQAVCDQVLSLDKLANVQTLETLLAQDPAH